MKGIIRLGYRKLINSYSTDSWDKQVFEATHREFYMQAQQFDQQGKYETFQEIVANIPKAEQMHYLVSTAAFHHIKQLNEIMPDVKNALGQLCIPFKNFRFEIIQSHIHEKKQHEVAIFFYSEPLSWIDTVTNHLLVSTNYAIETFPNREELSTELIALIPNLSIVSFKAGHPNLHQ